MLYPGLPHRPWVIGQSRYHFPCAEAQITVNTMIETVQLPDEPPLLHYSDRMDVVTWYLERLSEASSRTL